MQKQQQQLTDSKNGQIEGFIKQETISLRVKRSNAYEHPYWLICKVYPCSSNTFVVIPKNEQIARHLNDSSTILQQKILNCQVELHMIHQNLAFYWEIQNQTNDIYFYQWNVQNNQVQKFHCQLSYNQYGHIYFFTFPESGLLCICGEDKDRKKFLATYFQLPIKAINSKPISKSMSIQLISQNLCVFQSDNHSGLIFTEKNQNCKGWLQFNKLSFQEDEIKLQKYQLEHNFPHPETMAHFIQDIWSPMDGKIYMKFKLRISKKQFQNTMKNKSHLQRTKNYDSLIKKQAISEYIWKYTQNKLNKVEFCSPSKQKYSIVQFANGLRKIRILKPIQNIFQDLVLFDKMRKPQIPRYQLADIYYVDPIDWSVVWVQQGKGRCCYNIAETRSTCFPQFNTFMYIDYEIRVQQQFYEINVKTVRINPLKYTAGIIISFMLQQLIENCSEHLVQTVVEMLKQDK